MTEQTQFLVNHGAPIVFVELGMVGITGSPGFLNKGGG